MLKVFCLHSRNTRNYAYQQSKITYFQNKGSEILFVIRQFNILVKYELYTLRMFGYAELGPLAEKYVTAGAGERPIGDLLGKICTLGLLQNRTIKM